MQNKFHAVTATSIATHARDSHRAFADLSAAFVPLFLKKHGNYRIVEPYRASISSRLICIFLSRSSSFSVASKNPLGVLQQGVPSPRALCWLFSELL